MHGGKGTLTIGHQPDGMALKRLIVAAEIYQGEYVRDALAQQWAACVQGYYGTSVLIVPVFAVVFVK